jgi:hypothetical protein
VEEAQQIEQKPVQKLKPIKKGKFVVYTWQKALSAYLCPAQMINEALGLVTWKNTTKEQCKQLRQRMKEIEAVVTKGRKRKKYHRKHSEQDFIRLKAVEYGRSHNMSWRDALQIIKEHWPNPPE